MQAPDITVQKTLRRLRGRIAVSRFSLFLERFIQAFWPFLTVCAVLGAMILWGLGGFLPMKAYLGILALGLLAGVIALAVGAGRFRWPTRLEAILRLDKGLPGHPLATLLDTQSVGAQDASSAALWQAHVARVAGQADGAVAKKPNLEVSKSDPWALRLIALLALISGLFFGRADTIETVSAQLKGSDVPTAIASYEGWLEPPRYTGLPVLYLNDLPMDGAITAPVGSEITLRTYGDSDPQLTQSVSSNEAAFDEASDVRSLKLSVSQSGEVSLSTASRTWVFQVAPDAPPSVQITGGVTASGEGVMQVPFEASDDYGVALGTMQISLDLDAVERRFGLVAAPDDTADIIVDLPMPFRTGRDAFADSVTQDFSQHPWVGLPVKVTLSVTDDAEQTGTSTTLKTALLGRSFFNPVAAALVEQRRDLLWSSANVRRVVQVLKAITYRPDDVFTNNVAFLTVRTAIRRLEYSGVAERDSVAELLWQAAVLLEDGAFGDARERLKRAQDRLSEAMKDGASQEEVDRLMEELRQAMDDFMKEGARNAQKQPSDGNQDGERQEITQNQIAEMMDKIEQMLREGQVAEAEQLLEQMRQMMENLEFTQGEEGEGGEGQQAMEGLQDTLRQQQQLADDAFRQLQEQFNQNQGTDNSQGLNSPGNQQGHSSDGQSGDGGENTPNGQGAQDLAQRQEALRQMLEEQRGQLEGDAGGQSLQDAERAMGQAQQNLSNGNTEDALNDQADAMEALREGMQQIGEGQREGRDRASRQGDQQGRNTSPSRDPLGRDAANGGVSDRAEGNIDGAAARRAQEILEEIRRRSGERTRPQGEREYLDRLLDRF